MALARIEGEEHRAPETLGNVVPLAIGALKLSFIKKKEKI